MKVNEENREELLREYVTDIYNAMNYAIPRRKPSVETLGRFSHSSLVSKYALTLEFLYRVRENSSILMNILDKKPFKPHNLEEFSKNFEKLNEKCRERERQEFLRLEERRKKLVEYRYKPAAYKKKKG